MAGYQLWTKEEKNKVFETTLGIFSEKNEMQEWRSL